MDKKPSIGRAEVEVLRFIADKGGASVTEVGDHLAETKGQTRNTALNMMERLRQKGFLERVKKEGVFRYTPSETKGTLFESFVDDFVNSVLGGSVAPLVASSTRFFCSSLLSPSKLPRIPPRGFPSVGSGAPAGPVPRWETGRREEVVGSNVMAGWRRSITCSPISV